MTKKKDTNLSLFQLRKLQTEFPTETIASSRISADLIRKFYSDDIGIFESFFILLLNRANVTTGYAKISQGGVAGTVVDIRIICKYAVEALASGVIIAHNHPSGLLKPSPPDLELTTRVKKALDIFQINLLDHIILSETGYYSFADEGML